MAKPLVPPGDELRGLRQRADLSLDRLAKAAGYAGASSIQRYEDPDLAGGRALPLEVVRRLERALVGRGSPPIEREEVYALAGLAEGLLEAVGGAGAIVVSGDEFAVVDRLEPRGDVSRERRWLFRTDWLRTLARDGADRLAVVDMSGDAMSPGIAHGDAVLIDRGQSDPRDRFGAVYALRRDGVLHVRRINPARRSGCFDVTADNAAHGAWADVEPDEVEVLGRAVWIARRL